MTCSSSVGFASFLQRRAKRGDQLVRQVADETDGIGQRGLQAGRQVQPPHRRIECREQLVGGVGAGACQSVEQRRLAGVGVADERDGRHLGPLALLARRLALHEHLVEAVVQRLDALADQPAVGLELRFARAAQADAALLPLEVGPAAHEPGGHVLQLGEFDLQLAFEGARALREDVEDQAAAIEHAAFEFLLEIALLARAQRAIDRPADRRRGPRCARAAP